MKNYEALIILVPDMTEEKVQTVSGEIKQALEQEKALDLVEVKVEKKPLAYPIRRHPEAYYAHYTFSAEGSAIEKMRASLRHKPEIMRMFFTERIEQPAGG